MRLKYIFHEQNKSNWEPPFQPSVTLETHLEEVKQKTKLVSKERKALLVLQQSKDLNFKKADKRKNDKIQEGQVQINDLDNYKPLNKPIVKETHKKVTRDLKTTSWKLP